MAHRRGSPLVLAFPLTALLLFAALLTGAVAFAGSSASPSLTRLHRVAVSASTVPATGDINLYGAAVVQHSTGHLVAGNVLASNFNNSTNAQGTGSTIVQVTPAGAVSLFAHIVLPASECPGGVGLTTALGVLLQGGEARSDGAAASAVRRRTARGWIASPAAPSQQR